MLLRGMQWNFSANDFAELSKIELFRVLAQGDGTDGCLLKQYQDNIPVYQYSDLRKILMNTFQDIYVAIISRIAK